MKTLYIFVASLAIFMIGCGDAGTADAGPEGSSTVYEGDYQIVTVSLPGMT